MFNAVLANSMLMSAKSQKRTWAPHKRMSVLGQKRTLGRQFIKKYPSLCSRFFKTRCYCLNDQKCLRNMISP
jgi:hypothetical protein